MHPLAVDLEPVDVGLAPCVTDGVQHHRAALAVIARVVELKTESSLPRP